MQITRSQMKGMLAGSDTLLRHAIQRLVRGEHAYVVQDLPQKLFDRMVDAGVASARGFGLREPSDLACFVLLMFEFGPGFWRHPAVERVLRNASQPPAQRLQQVVQRTPPTVWQEIEATLHEQHWFPEAFQADEAAEGGA
jgi:hypothetical protein